MHDKKVGKSSGTNNNDISAAELLALLILALMKEIVLPALSNQKEEVTENDHAENTDQQQVVTKKNDVLRFLFQILHLISGRYSDITHTVRESCYASHTLGI